MPYDDDPHRQAYENAMAHAWQQNITAITELLTMPTNNAGGHTTDDDAYYYCPRPECPCHEK